MLLNLSEGPEASAAPLHCAASERGKGATTSNQLRDCWGRVTGILPELGAVLAVFPDRPTWPGAAPSADAPWPRQRRLLGLVCAARARLVVELECQGPIELLCFDDWMGRPGFALGLLPDSNHFAWDELLQGLPHTVANLPASAFDCAAQRRGDRLWPSTQDWQARALRFMVSRARDGTQLCSETPASLSAPGHAHAVGMARRVAARLLG